MAISYSYSTSLTKALRDQLHSLAKLEMFLDVQNTFPMFRYYFVVMASKSQCILTDIIVCLTFVSYLHHKLTG